MSPPELIEMPLELPHPPELVWRALTDPALLERWLLPVVNHSLEPGARFSFRAPPQPGWDGTVRCELLAIDPPHAIHWSWVVGALDTQVSFTLTPIDQGTRLTLRHSGFTPDQKQNRGGARYGWRMMLQRLEELLATSPSR